MGNYANVGDIGKFVVCLWCSWSPYCTICLFVCLFVDCYFYLSLNLSFILEHFANSETLARSPPSHNSYPPWRIKPITWFHIKLLHFINLFLMLHHRLNTWRKIRLIVVALIDIEDRNDIHAFQEALPILLSNYIQFKIDFNFLIYVRFTFTLKGVTGY